MKKFVLISTLAVVMSVAGIANAYQFEDMIDYWSVDCTGEWSAAPEGGPWTWDSAEITESRPLSYTHDINDSVNFLAGDLVTEAYLELDFTNDLTDEVGSKLWGLIKWDYREFATVGFDGTEWHNLDEVDAGQYELVVNIDWINNDGFLDVELQVWNPLCSGFGANATAWLDHSRLYGEAQAQAPIPEPGTMLLLGSGVIALLALGRKKFTK